MIACKKSRVATIRPLIDNPLPLLFVEAIGLACGLARGLAMVADGDPRRWTSRLSQGATLKLFNALRYDRFYRLYMGATLILGLYLALAAFGT